MQDLLIDQLKNIEVTPREAWKKSTRSFLLAEIRSTKAVIKNIPANNFFEKFRFIKFAWRPVGVFALLGLFFMGGSGLLMAASQNATPGEKMFVVKRIIEKTQGLIIADNSQRVELAGALLGNRVNELQKVMVQESQLVAANRGNQPNRITLAMNEVNKQLADVNDRVNQLKIEPPGNKKVAVMVLTLNEKIRNYKDELKQLKTKTVDAKVNDKLTETLSQVSVVNNNVLGVIVAKQKQGELAINDKEIENKLNDHLTNIEERTNKIEKILADDTINNNKDLVDKTSEVKQKIEDAREAIKNNKFTLVLALAKGSNEILNILYGEIYKVIKNDSPVATVSNTKQTDDLDSQDVALGEATSTSLHPADAQKTQPATIVDSKIIEDKNTTETTRLPLTEPAINKTVTPVKDLQEFDVGIK